ncbi:hypothetical protein LEMLEM_LOCUS14143 [Lemmus lemmus]
MNKQPPFNILAPNVGLEPMTLELRVRLECWEKEGGVREKP